ncbi:MAG TPA: aldehyde dehydrogenase family protein, partial [Jatrophihabitans sp.]|nr:aldehyde dehydrogenase family protein [Jatrophihabitans sp.]
DGVVSRPAAEPAPGPAGADAVVCRVPRGRVLTVICPSNHPEPHVTWVRGLAAGYRVLVRPGSADPFTPNRLSAALVAAGLPAERLAVLPSPHATADLLVRSADRAIVYGGPAAARRWSGHPSVLVRGPGFSKALVTGAAPATEALLDHLADAVGGDGGVRCTNLSVIRAAGDARALARSLAARLAAWPVQPVTEPRAVLPALPVAAAEAVRDQLGRLLDSGLVDESGYAADPFVLVADGSLIARPVVLSAPAGVAVPEVELPFPFVIVAPWQAADGLEPVRNSLVLNLLAGPADVDDAGALARAYLEPSIRKLVHGAIPPWSTAPGLPHDGSLDDFLLEPKTVLERASREH